MKTKKKSTKHPSEERTEVPGQNPKANDAPERTVYHDESRSNQDQNPAQTPRTPKGENL